MDSHPALDFFTTADGTKYAYSFTRAQDAKATFLFLHGYPGSHRDWQLQITALIAHGFGVLAPDMLGFGASDMPTDLTQYRAKRLADHITELLDHKSLDTVIGVGHDWGSAVLSRLAVYHQKRFDKLVWISLGHVAPGGFLDIDAMNQWITATHGYTPFGYWYFFNRYDAGSVIKNHLESFWHIIFPENNKVWKDNFAPIGALRAWLNADTRTEDPPFLDEAYKTDWLAWMSRPNATEAGLSIYRSQLAGINDDDEGKLTNEDWVLQVPVLTIGGELDVVTRSELMERTRPWAAAGLTTRTLNGGHWLARELPEDVNKILIDFAEAESA